MIRRIVKLLLEILEQPDLIRAPEQNEFLDELQLANNLANKELWRRLIVDDYILDNIAQILDG